VLPPSGSGRFAEVTTTKEEIKYLCRETHFEQHFVAYEQLG
jgi:hypothetical protein